MGYRSVAEACGAMALDNVADPHAYERVNYTRLLDGWQATPNGALTMADTKPDLWHGIPREEIPWRPTVDPDACIGCQLCYITCGRAVYEMEDGVAVEVDPMNCAVGCTTCGNICPTGAITFPPMDAVWKTRTRTPDLPHRQDGGAGSAAWVGTSPVAMDPVLRLE